MAPLVLPTGAAFFLSSQMVRGGSFAVYGDNREPDRNTWPGGMASGLGGPNKYARLRAVFADWLL